MGDSFASKEEVSALKASIDRLEKMMEQLLADKNKSPNVEVSSADGDPPHCSAGSTPYDKGPRFEFPQFSGTEDPLSWLYRCELYFMNQNIAPAKRVSTAAYYLTGEAQLWYHHLRQDQPHISWDQFRSYCNHRFGPPGGANPLGDLTNLKQHGRLVEEYITDFQNCLSRVPPLQTAYQVAIFTAGLDEVLRIDVEYQQPLNLTMAISVARTFARKLQLWSSPPLPIGASTTEPTSTPPPSTQPSPPTQPPPPTRAPTSHTTIAPLKRLTRERPNDALKVFVTTAMNHMFLAIHANACFVYGSRETKKLVKAPMDLRHALKDGSPTLLTTIPMSPNGDLTNRTSSLRTSLI
ncbi:hypothetical protein LINGRAHAP2_LOCUS25031 [Linum grandiflorum]